MVCRPNVHTLGATEAAERFFQMSLGFRPAEGVETLLQPANEFKV